MRSYGRSRHAHSRRARSRIHVPLAAAAAGVARAQRSGAPPRSARRRAATGPRGGRSNARRRARPTGASRGPPKPSEPCTPATAERFRCADRASNLALGGPHARARSRVWRCPRWCARGRLHRVVRGGIGTPLRRRTPASCRRIRRRPTSWQSDQTRSRAPSGRCTCQSGCTCGREIESAGGRLRRGAGAIEGAVVPDAQAHAGARVREPLA